MPHWSRVLAGLTTFLLLSATPLAAIAQEGDGASAIEPEALAVIDAMAKKLTEATTFAYKTETSYDVVQDSGLKVEFGGSRHSTIQRPDHFRLDSQRRAGSAGIMVFDGKQLSAFVPEHKAYATTEFEGDMQEAIDYLVSELRVKAPLAELVSPDVATAIRKDLTRALHLGPAIVAGHDTHHLLLSNDYADFQMWIDEGDEPVMRRIVITYREERGEPQFRAQFVEWDFSPDTKGLFDFEPPEDAERVLFYIPGPEDALDEEDAS